MKHLLPRPNRALPCAARWALPLILAPLGLAMPQADATPPGQDTLDPEGGEVLGRALSGIRQPETIWGELRLESMGEVLEREKTYVTPGNHRVRGERQGEWQIPSRKIQTNPHSGEKCLLNRWGDISMGIGLGDPKLDVHDVWVASQGGEGIWAEAIRFVGYADGVQVGASPWFEDIDGEPSLMPIGLTGVDRIVVEAKPSATGAGFYALDDLRFSGPDGVETILDFEDTQWGQRLKESDYRGFTWEEGTGSFAPPGPKIVPAPQEAPGRAPTATSEADEPVLLSNARGGSGTAPTLLNTFQGPRLGDTGAGFIPPDTCGAVGVNHFCAIVNANLSIYDKVSGNRLLSVSLPSFFGAGGSVGDPRIAYDFDEDRWVAIATDFDELCFFAYSATSDPMGPWLKTSLDFVEGFDDGKWIDYPTLGVDSRGFFIEAYMVGTGSRMSIFAIDKAPLLAATPSVGTVTAFRNLSWDGAIQHATQYTDAGVSWMISTRTATSMRLRRINAPLSNPTMTNLVVNGIPAYQQANSAPAMGSTVNVSTGGTRLMNACYVNGSIWASHTVSAGGRSGARWYEIDPATQTLLQSGTLTDPSLWLYFPSIAADAEGNVAMGFSGSDENTFPSTYFSGRRGNDTPGEMGPATLYAAGLASYTLTDGNGTNRWGDYSLTTLDPVDGTFWTIQERTRNQQNSWTTQIAQLQHPPLCGDIERYCSALPNQGGTAASIDTAGSTSVAQNDLDLVCFGLPGQTFGLFFYGQNRAFAPIGDGNLCIDNPFFRLPVVQSSILGIAAYDLDLTGIPNPVGQISTGETWNFSFWYRQVSAAGFNFSDAISVEFCD